MYLCDVLMICVCVYKVKPAFVGLHVMYLCDVLMICVRVYKVKPAFVGLHVMYLCDVLMTRVCVQSETCICRSTCYVFM